MKRHKPNGFSLLEVIAAVVILAVVAAATVATVAPMRAKSEEKLDQQQAATLNAMTQTYFLEVGRYPSNVWQLVNEGYLSNNTPEERDRINQIERDFSYNRNRGVFTPRNN